MNIKFYRKFVSLLSRSNHFYMIEDWYSYLQILSTNISIHFSLIVFGIITKYMKQSIRLNIRFILMILGVLFSIHSMAQKNEKMVRLAKIEVDPAQLESYKQLLTEEVEASLRLEPGVLMLYPVADKKNPAHITILEIYDSKEAYEAHLKTAHFLKYKNGTLHMVKALELVETDPLLTNLIEK